MLLHSCCACPVACSGQSVARFCMRPPRSRSSPRAQRALDRLLGGKRSIFYAVEHLASHSTLSNKTSPWPLLLLPGFFNILRPVPPGTEPPSTHHAVTTITLIHACPVPSTFLLLRTPSPFARLLFTAIVRPCPSDQAPPFNALWCCEQAARQRCCFFSLQPLS
jgi:hypothetical protein